jgi:hypothetical protein
MIIVLVVLINLFLVVFTLLALIMFEIVYIEFWIVAL